MHSILDDAEQFHKLDPHGMLALAEGFAQQCREAWGIGLTCDLAELGRPVRSVMLTGMGGSAAGGDFLQCIFDAHGKVPFTVNRDYHIPQYVGLDDYVFCASYSGGTEETLSAYGEAKELGAQIVVISSGGELSERAKTDGYPLIEVPGGQPPRTAMGYMMIPVLVACERMGLVSPQPYEICFQELEAVSKELTLSVPKTSNLAKQIAHDLHGAFPYFYGLGPALGVVAHRWKCQAHENAKTLAVSNAFSELNHNEILGWVNASRESVGRFSGVLLTHADESEKMMTRAKVTQKLIGEQCRFTTVESRGDDLLTRMLTLASIGDFVTLYLARLYCVDPENIDSINTLKAELSIVG